MERAVYLDHRKYLMDLGASQLGVFDKSILYLSAGALGLSVAFLEKIVGPTPAIASGTLFAAWFFYIFAILANLLSYKLSWKDTCREIEEIDRKYESDCWDEQSSNPFRVATMICNYVALFAFVAGTLCLLYFSFVNLKPGS